MSHKTDTLRLTLGTAQLGMRYGLANRTGQPDDAGAAALVAAAWRGGVRRFDTAMHYGVSERVLGRCLAAIAHGAEEAEVVSKLAPEADPFGEGVLAASIRASLQNLGVRSLAGFLLHRERLLDRWDDLRPDLDALVGQGLARRVGISVYDPQSALRALGLPGLGLLQVPSGVLDRRFEQAGVFAAAAAAGIRVQVRSVFLQGLLLLNPQQAPARMDFALPHVRDFQALCAEAGRPPAEIALAYAWTAYPHADILVGAESEAQIRANLCAAAPLPPGLAEEIRSRFARVPVQVLNPSLWPSEGAP